MQLLRLTTAALSTLAVVAAPRATAETTGDALNPATSPESAAASQIATDLPDPAVDLPIEKTVLPAAPSANVTVNLINRLVQKGILSQAEAGEMIQQAEADAAAVAQARVAPLPLPPEPSPSDEMRIAYIPEVVRKQMREQIQQEVMATAREENWVGRKQDDWTTRFKPFGDVRTRSENIMFPDGNANNGSFPDFNHINTGMPYDTSVSNPQFAPQRNVDEDRYRMRLRARAGTSIMLGEGFDAGLRLATGNDNSPTSPNQTMTGNFAKYAVWLDRAFLSYEAGPGDGRDLTFYAGRFDNPFFATEIQWDDDIGFDGLAVRGKVPVGDSTSIFFTGGYFPIFNTDLNFASNQPDKFGSTDRWLTGAQIGVEWKVNDDLKAKLAVAYYDFQDMKGRLSTPFIPLTPEDVGDTDSLRPPFAQSGNTYIPLRNIDNSTAANDFGNQSQFQYFGLASEFRNVTVTGRVDYDFYDPYRLSLIGEATKNVAFDVDPGTALNNRGSSGQFDGGDTAFFLHFIVGKPALETFGDWQAEIGYRYVESDAIVDGFTDSRFGGGTTNVKGFSLGGMFALTRDVRCNVRWLSADEVAGPPLKQDTLQVDLHAHF